MPAPTLLTLVRHGETSANIDKVWHGSTDTALTERGHRQAARVADWIRTHRADATTVYASPLQRARHTGEAIAAGLGLPLQLDPALTEFHLGEWEGLPFNELFHGRRLGELMRENPDFCAPAAESPRQVAERLAGAVTRIAAAHPGERVVAVTHSAALSLGLGLLLDRVPNAWTRFLENCAVCELTVSDEIVLAGFNLKEHLIGL